LRPVYCEEMSAVVPVSAIEEAARRLEGSARGLYIVPPFDHPCIIAGQGTVGLEILRDCAEVARVSAAAG